VVVYVHALQGESRAACVVFCLVNTELCVGSQHSIWQADTCSITAPQSPLGAVCTCCMAWSAAASLGSIVCMLSDSIGSACWLSESELRLRRARRLLALPLLALLPHSLDEKKPADELPIEPKGDVGLRL